MCNIGNLCTFKNMTITFVVFKIIINHCLKIFETMNRRCIGIFFIQWQNFPSSYRLCRQMSITYLQKFLVEVDNSINKLLSQFLFNEMAAVSDFFSIGSVVWCRTCYNKDVEGEVLAFDPQTKILILSILFLKWPSLGFRWILTNEALDFISRHCIKLEHKKLMFFIHDYYWKFQMPNIELFICFTIFLSSIIMRLLRIKIYSYINIQLFFPQQFLQNVHHLLEIQN